MSDSFKPDDGGAMENFFDNLMSDHDAAQFLAEKKLDQSFVSQWQLQKRIDASLKDIFSFDVPLESDLVPVVAHAVDSDHIATVKAKSGHMLRLVKLVLAASLLGVVCWYGWQQLGGDSPVVFQPVPLVQIYNQSVENGFKPYYECHDMQRFADTFEHRQGVALTLAQMPDDRCMLGLSYLGGVSRESTAMLCQVQDQPVMVFVDTVAHDRSDLAESHDPALKVFREEKFGLVFYEVTPLKRPTMIGYFELAKVGGAMPPGND